MGLTRDDLLAAIKEADDADLLPILEAANARFGTDRVRSRLALTRNGTGPAGANPFSEGIIAAADLPPAVPAATIWFGLYPGKLTLLIGQTGAGKSTLLYNFAVHAALNRPYLAHPFGLNRPVRTLYLDPENAGDYRGAHTIGGLCAAKLDRIGLPRTHDLLFHDGRGVDLTRPEHIAALTDLVAERRIDLLIVEPLAILFHTLDENANAEAAAQMTALHTLCAAGAAVLAVHHTGKFVADDYGRGASARLAAADVGLLFRSAENDRDADDDAYAGAPRQRGDICRLKVVKDRVGAFGRASLYLRMVGDDRFDVAAASDWRACAETGQSRRDKAAEACDLIVTILSDGAERTRQAIIAEIKDADLPDRAALDALTQLTAEGRITRRAAAHGAHHYTIAPPPGTPVAPDPQANTLEI